MEHQKLNKIIGFAVLVISLIVYGKTVAPTTSYWDCGEFISSSYILGVPHPPGAPLHVLVGRVFTMIPDWLISDIGLRVNIISVLVSALSVMFAYLIIVRLIREFKGIPETVDQKINIYTAGVIGALGFALTDSQWFNAVEAEVYAVSIFFTTIVVWLILVWLEKAENPVSDKILVLIAYLIGLATGVHLLNILAIPTLFLIVYFKKAELNIKTFSLWAAGAIAAFAAIYPGIVKGIPWLLNKFSFLAIGLVTLGVLFAIVYAVQNQKRLVSLALMSILLVTVGYSTYTALYIRSDMHPAINENHPNTPKKFVSYLNREQYGELTFFPRRYRGLPSKQAFEATRSGSYAKHDFGKQVKHLWNYQIKKMYIRYFGWQFIGKGTTLGPDNYIVEVLSGKGLMGWPFLIGLIGMFFHFRRDWKHASSILTLFIMTGIAITIYLNQEDPQPRERDYAYVGSFFAFSIWIGMGVSAILELVQNAFRQNSPLRKVGIGLTILLLIMAVPSNLYLHNAHPHDRSGNYVAFDYSYNILQSFEANAILFTNGDNDTFPLWYLQYVEDIRRDVRVVNLSLLNTPWYIKQLRDEEPKVPIALTNTQIDQLGPALWSEPKMARIEVPRDKLIGQFEKAEDNASFLIENVPQNPAIEFELVHTKIIQGHKVLLVQDRMIIHILAANKFKKPVYFAVTVSPTNMLNLDNRRNVKDSKNYLRMDGLAFRVMPYGGPKNDFISPVKLEANLFEHFKYRNLDNPEVYFNNNIIGLLQNYRSAFLRLTNYYRTQGLTQNNKEKALAVLQKMDAVMPEEVIPLRDFRLSLNFGQMYSDFGNPQGLEDRLDKILKIYNLRTIDQLYIAEFYAQILKNNAKAESLVVSLREENPETREIYLWLASHYTRSRRFDDGIQVLEKWMNDHPEDLIVKKELTELQAFASANDSLNISNSSSDSSSAKDSK